MSIASLLSHHGVHVPRYVTVDGRIVFDGVSVTSDGATIHDTFGPVTAVQGHKFHGGMDQLAAVKGEPWWNDSVLVSRHIDAMNQSFPGFEYFAGCSSVAPRWRGKIDTGRGRFTLEIELRADGSLPMLRVPGLKLGAFSSGRWEPSPHLYLSGNLCVADRDDWDSEMHTAATAVAWGAHWLAAYTEWRMSRRWPANGTYARAS